MSCLYYCYLVGVDYTSDNAQIVIQLGYMILALSELFYFRTPFLTKVVGRYVVL